MSDYPEICKKMKPRDCYCYEFITDNTNFDFLVDYEPIKVFYNESILDMATNIIDKILPTELQESNLIQLNGYHTSVGFQSDSYAFTTDLICENGIGETLAPDIEGNTLNWNNQNQLTYNDANSVMQNTNIPYWDRSTYITTITKKDFMNVLTDIKKYLTTYPIYALFNVNLSSNTDLLHPDLHGLTCDSFAYFVLNKLQKYGAKINIMTPPKSNIVTYVADTITPLHFSKDKEEIITFYKNYKKLYKKIAREIGSITTLNILQVITNIHNQILAELNNKFIYYCYAYGEGKPSYYRLSLNQTKPLIATYMHGLLKNDITHNSVFGVHPKPKPKPKPDCTLCPKPNTDCSLCPKPKPDCAHCPKPNPDCSLCPKPNPDCSLCSNPNPDCPLCSNNKKNMTTIFIIISIILSILLIFGFIYHITRK